MRAPARAASAELEVRLLRIRQSRVAIPATRMRSTGLPNRIQRWRCGTVRRKESSGRPSERATTLDRPDGLTKLIVDPDTEHILGVGIVGSGAGELISECTLAIEMGVVAADLKMTIHPHPTLSETVMEAADVFFGESAHVYKPKKRAEGLGVGIRDASLRGRCCVPRGRRASSTRTEEYVDVLQASEAQICVRTV